MTGLRARATAAFDEAVRGLRSVPLPGLENAAEDLAACRARLSGPMRVALVGRVSSGKSTLANALLGAPLAPTGVEELTFNVNWIGHGPRRELTVHFTDGRPPERRDPAELEALTVRARDGDKQHRRLLRAIDHLRVTDPNEHLRAFDLVDTPGLDSVFQTDSQNTLRFLGRTGDDVRAASAAHAGRADALVVVFARGLAANEEELLADFAGPGVGGSGPVTTVAALTKVELSWPQYPDPLAEGRRLAERVMSAPGARRVLYEVRPIASLVAAAAATFTEDELGDLIGLSTVDPSTLERRLRRGPFFATREYDDLPVPPQRRAALLRRFGQYGIWLAAGLVRDGARDAAELRAELTARSGLPGFRALLTGHFGNRAELIKLRGALDLAYRLRDRRAAALGPHERAVLLDACAPLLALDRDEHAFRELEVLRLYYDDALAFTPDDAADLLRVTGEHGTAPADRLGLPSPAAPPELLAAARARLGEWAARDLDPLYEGRTRRAVQVVRRSYERLVTTVREPA
ncbi:dynamin family protein [Dactylosporangium sp. CS-033363]|uniref:dynamin family protein n=1 Tax=Dactylosporangium sp. CS-033363 TaxID=3239935 RepID=UPI003D8C39CB